HQAELTLNMCKRLRRPSRSGKHHALASLEKSARAILGHSRAYRCIDFDSDRNVRFCMVAPKEQMAALRDRLRLGKQVQEHIRNELDSLKLTASRQEAILNDLRSTGGVPRSQVELLSTANAAVINSLADLEQANTNLGFALTFTGGQWA